MTDTTPVSLTSEADQYDRAAWEAGTAAVLRKARKLAEDAPDAQVWDLLTRTTLDGIEVPPLGVPADAAQAAPTGVPGQAPFTRGRTATRPEIGWDIRSQLSGLGAAQAHEIAHVDLTNGVTSLWVRLSSTLGPADLATALDGVFLDLAPVVLEACEEPLAAAQALVELLADADGPPAEGTNLGADPIGVALRRDPTTAGRSAQADLDTLVEIAELARRAGTLGIVVDGTAVHDLGATDAEELGYALAVGIAYLRRLEAAGWSIEDALGLIEFRFAATDEQFPTIAKLRAARRLWSRVGELCGAVPELTGMRQHVVTSQPMMSRYDPYVNMLRGTVAAFAAGVAGADAVTVLPFDSPLGVPETLGRRNARNTSSLLISESHLARVADPAGGSYAIERLTDRIAEAGWEALGRIESAGGVLAALTDGSLQSRIEASVAEREQQIARRTRPLTGLTEFPNLREELPQRVADPTPGSAEQVRRYGATFEALRDEPAATPVFLATMGTVTAHTARATFVTNLFAAGGVDVEVAGASTGVADVLTAYDGQPVVCLAGPDPAYAEWGADLVAALREAGARHVILAGKPGEKTVAADLIDDSAALGVDALAFLTTTRENLR